MVQGAVYVYCLGLGLGLRIPNKAFVIPCGSIE